MMTGTPVGLLCCDPMEYSSAMAKASNSLPIKRLCDPSAISPQEDSFRFVQEMPDYFRVGPVKPLNIANWHPWGDFIRGGQAGSTVSDGCARKFRNHRVDSSGGRCRI